MALVVGSAKDGRWRRLAGATSKRGYEAVADPVVVAAKEEEGGQRALAAMEVR